jgi:hypothetical protein
MGTLLSPALPSRADCAGADVLRALGRGGCSMRRADCEDNRVLIRVQVLIRNGELCTYVSGATAACTASSSPLWSGATLESAWLSAAAARWQACLRRSDDTDDGLGSLTETSGSARSLVPAAGDEADEARLEPPATLCHALPRRLNKPDRPLRLFPSSLTGFDWVSRLLIGIVSSSKRQHRAHHPPPTRVLPSDVSRFGSYSYARD